MNDFSYPELYERLKDKGYRPAIVVDCGGNISGIEIDALGITGSAKLEIVESESGESFKCHYFPNTEILSIKKK